MARRKPEEAEPGAPGWIVSFADMMSLLLTFFILLLSFSTMEESRVKEALTSLKGALGVLPKSMSPIKEPNVKPPAPLKPTKVETEISRLKEKMNNKGLDQQVRVKATDRGVLNIKLPESVLFRSGSAELLPSAYPVLKDVADLLEFHLDAHESDIRVEGHTDDVPISNIRRSVFASNWELSAARAISVMRHLTNVESLPEEYFSVAGFADNEPLQLPVNLEENRRTNRRVEITAIPQKAFAEAEKDTELGPGGVKRMVPSDADVEWEEPL
jgi:chemotaxis protein MotB